MENKQIKQTEIVVVLDRSGSMGSISKSTVEGFNTFLNEQKNSEGQAFLTLVQFDDRYEVDYKSVPIKDVTELVDGVTFNPRGLTGLYDAIGKTINELQTDRDVVFVIITDGQENASREFNGKAVKKMIETLEAENKWKFLYLGANQDAITAGNSIGVKAANSMSWNASADGITNTFHSMSANIGTYRMSKMKYTADANVTMDDFLSQEADKLGFSKEQRDKSIDKKNK
jgi:hypothetical protein